MKGIYTHFAEADRRDLLLQKNRFQFLKTVLNILKNLYQQLNLFMF